MNKKHYSLICFLALTLSINLVSIDIEKEHKENNVVMVNVYNEDTKTYDFSKMPAIYNVKKKELK